MLSSSSVRSANVAVNIFGTGFNRPTRRGSRNSTNAMNSCSSRDPSLFLSLRMRPTKQRDIGRVGCEVNSACTTGTLVFGDVVGEAVVGAIVLGAMVIGAADVGGVVVAVCSCSHILKCVGNGVNLRVGATDGSFTSFSVASMKNNFGNCRSNFEAICA